MTAKEMIDRMVNTHEEVALVTTMRIESMLTRIQNGEDVRTVVESSIIGGTKKRYKGYLSDIDQITDILSIIVQDVSKSHKSRDATAALSVAYSQLTKARKELARSVA